MIEMSSLRYYCFLLSVIKIAAYIVPTEILYLISLLAFVDIIPDKLQNSFISHVKSVPICHKTLMVLDINDLGYNFITVGGRASIFNC